MGIRALQLTTVVGRGHPYWVLKSTDERGRVHVLCSGLLDDLAEPEETPAGALLDQALQAARVTLRG